MANTHSLDLESGSSQYASITDAAQTGLDFTGDFTVEFWCNRESDGVGGGGQYTLMKGSVAASAKWYGFFFNNDNTISFTIDDGTTAYIATSTTALTASSWFHVAGVRTGTDIKIYINGNSTAEATTAAVNTTLVNTDPFALGRRNNAGTLDRYYDGLIDEVRCWNDARTGAEIAANYDSELVGNEANLQGYWKLNNDYTDETANGNDLTAVNAPVFSATVPFTGSEAFTLIMEVGTFTLTGIATTFTKALNLVAEVGNLTLTGIDATFSKGQGIIAEVGTFTLTGINIVFTKALNVVLAAGSFTLTGIAAVFIKSKTLIAEVGTFLVSRQDAALRSTAWDNQSKPTTAWTESTKPTTTWTESTKPTSNWTNDTK